MKIPQFEYKSGKSSEELKDTTLLLPCVSVGNVGQLACDVIIATFNMERIGFIMSNCVLPVVGPNAFHAFTENAPMTLSVEVYHSAKHNITVIQQRSPLVKGRQNAYAESMMEWIKQIRFKSVFLLSSCFAHERVDFELTGSQIRYISNNKSCEMKHDAVLMDVGWKMYTNRTMHQHEKKLIVPGGGITVKYIDHSNKNDIPVNAVIIFCSEGNNIPEADMLINNLFQLPTFSGLKNDMKKLIQPPSWKHMFGNPIPSEIF